MEYYTSRKAALSPLTQGVVSSAAVVPATIMSLPQNRKHLSRGEGGTFVSKVAKDPRSIDERLADVDRLPWVEVKRLVSEVQHDPYAKSQTAVICAGFRCLLNGNHKRGQMKKEPRDEQARATRRLVFGLGDTLLIARTGFREERY